VNKFLLESFNSELQKIAFLKKASDAFTSVSKGSRGAKAPGVDLGLSTRSPWYKKKQYAPTSPDLGTNVNRTSPKGV